MAERTRLLEGVVKVFDEDASLVLTCVFYIACHEGTLYHCEQWSAGNDTSFDERQGDQRISELPTRIDRDHCTRFLCLWMEKLGDNDNYALDITSYIQAIEAVKAENNRDGEDLEQINLALLIGSRFRLPAYYSFIPGNVNNKISLKRFIHTVKAQGSQVSA